MTRVLDKTLRGLTKHIREFLIAGEAASRDGFLQKVDARIKLVGLLALIISTVASESLPFLLFLLIFSFILAPLSKISLRTLIGRFLFIPLFAFIISLPQFFLMEGDTLFVISFLSITLQATYQGLFYLLLFNLRVTTSVSFLTLLILTTEFSEIMAALRWYKVPSTILQIIKFTYRYIFLLFSELHRMLLAREAKMLTKKSFRETWGELSQLIGNLFIRTLEKGEKVYLAALGRGFKGEYESYPIERKIQKEAGFFVLLTSFLIFLVFISIFFPEKLRVIPYISNLRIAREIFA